ncbi:hypothetical protein, partial [Virgibacillus salexigens]
MATTQQVADFYEVSVDTIKTVLKRNKTELKSDGFVNGSGKFVKVNLTSTEIQQKQGYFLITDNQGNEVKVNNVRNSLFPKRAILRVGMLLRDSEVAKEVR